MLKAATEFFLQLHAQGLGHEAVIEIMIALLGVMLTVVALLVGFASWFGYASIKKASIKQAKRAARKVALEESNKVYRAFFSEERAAEYSESQKDLLPDEDIVASLSAPVSSYEPESARLKPTRKRAATSDSNLKRRSKSNDPRTDKDRKEAPRSDPS